MKLNKTGGFHDAYHFLTVELFNGVLIISFSYHWRLLQDIDFYILTQTTVMEQTEPRVFVRNLRPGKVPFLLLWSLALFHLKQELELEHRCCYSYSLPHRFLLSSETEIPWSLWTFYSSWNQFQQTVVNNLLEPVFICRLILVWCLILNIRFIIS